MRYKIFKDGEEVNRIIAEPDFVEDYCTANGYTYEEEVFPEPMPEPEPTQLDMIEAQVTYTAMMTDTLLEV